MAPPGGKGPEDLLIGCRVNSTSCLQYGATTHTQGGRRHLLGLVGVEAGDGHDLGGTPRGGGLGGQRLPAKVFTEAFVHCWRNVVEINDP